MKSFTFQCRTPFCRVMSFLTLSLPLVLLMGLFSGQALAVCPLSGFEDDDGNLEFDGTCTDVPPTDSQLDWNDLAPVEWDEGTAPYRIADEVVSGWMITALEDDAATNSDTAFAGGTKQDDVCAQVKGAKAPNKDDLKRAYISSNTIDGNVILNLGWVRIPQNTTSPSAHIGFEFNQGETPCGGNSDGLVERTVGDMLIVYDFEGGATDEPTITLRRWIDSGACEVGSNSPPCWGTSTNLTALGFAEAKVNTTLVGPVSDDLAAPPPPATASVTETLQLNEFGEAGIDLTGAGVFDENVCLAFGKAFAVSRSSGNSANAQMKDLAGPGDVNIANCGAVVIRKVTDPSPDSSDTAFGFTATGGLTPATFSLKNGESQNYGANVFAGVYTVTEDDLTGTGWDFTSLDCSASTITNGTTIDTSNAPLISFDLKPLDKVDCTYTNTARGDITVSKTVENACTGAANDGGTFELFIGSTTKTVGHGGSLMEDDLIAGTYLVGETSAGAEYAATLGGDADCDDGSISLANGQSVSCTVTNVRQPHIKITKVVNGPAAAFDLKIDGVIYKDGVTGWVAGDGDDAVNGDSVEARVSIGNHTISETNSDGTAVDSSQWLVNITCSDGSVVQGSTSLANVSTGSGDFVECTIYNNAVAGAAACVEPNALP